MTGARVVLPSHDACALTLLFTAHVSCGYKTTRVLGTKLRFSQCKIYDIYYVRPLTECITFNGNNFNYKLRKYGLHTAVTAKL